VAGSDGTAGSGGAGQGGVAGNGAAGNGAAGAAGNGVAGAAGNGVAGAAGNGAAGSGPPPTYTVGGSIAGLTGTGLVLQDNAGDNLAVAANATGFTFTTGLGSGATYSVTILSQPSSPTQTCSVANGSGQIGTTPVNGVAITCSTNTYAVGGTVAGLTGTGLVLQDNNGDNLTVAPSATMFTFASAVPSGAVYAVSVLSQPTSPAQTCTVTKGSGHVGMAAVGDVAVTCATNSYTVGGSVTGLAGTGLVLQDNNGDDLTVASGANGFTFPIKVASGAAFSVSIKTQPTAPSQTCMVAGGSGTVMAGDVSSVSINCTVDKFAVGGSVTGLAGTLVLTDNGGDDLNVTSLGNFSFQTLVPSGMPYDVQVKAQPTAPSQTCTLANNMGTVMGTMVAVTVTCVTNAFNVKAAVTGVKGTGLKLANGADSVAAAADGTVTVSTAVLSGTGYSVMVAAQPVGQTCAVTAPASGTVGGSDVTVAVTCTDNLYSVKGTVTGATDTITLKNGADTLTVGNGAFAFPTKLINGASYAVTASGPIQTCTVTNGAGAIAAADTNVTVSCTGSLVYYFPFDGDATDKSGNGHDGDVHGATLVADRNGQADSAYSFSDGTWIQAAGDALPIGNDSRTLTAWVNLQDDHGQWGIISWGTGDCTGLMWGLGYQGSATFWGGCNDWQSGTYIPTDTWTWVAVRFTAPNHVTIRVNDTDMSADIGYADTQASNLWIGGETTDNADFRNYFHGSLDSIRIYNRALTDAELDSIYTTLP